MPRDGLPAIPLSTRQKSEVKDAFGSPTAGGSRADEKESKTDVKTGRFGRILQVKYRSFQKIWRIQRVKSRFSTELVVWTCQSPNQFYKVNQFHFSIVPQAPRFFKRVLRPCSHLSSKEPPHVENRQKTADSAPGDPSQVPRLYRWATERGQVLPRD